MTDFHYEKDADGIVTVTMDMEGQSANTMNERFVPGMDAVMARLRAEKGLTGVIYASAKNTFFAGGDLNLLATIEKADAETLHYVEENKRPYRDIEKLPVPVVAAINGAAAGAGANIALSADIILAARSASFLEAFARIGLIPDAGGTYWLPRLVGHARAMGMSLLADKISAEKALEWGLIWEVVDDDKLDIRAHEIAARLAKGPTKAYGLIKTALHASQGNDLAAQMELEATLQAQAGQSRDFKEGVMAFLEKRPAVYQGS